jgi:hypothetical protein
MLAPSDAIALVLACFGFGALIQTIANMARSGSRSR